MIFVHIASYRDPECGPTVRDLFAKAKNPDQIRVGIVLQSASGDAFHEHIDRTRWICVNSRETRGACWARSLGYRLWEGEEFVLQIDSHTRFIPGWDEKAITQLSACPSPKPALTTYAPPYEPPFSLLGNQPTFLVPIKFDERGYLEQNSHVHAHAPAPRPVALMSGHFWFSRSEWIREVPYDPHLYFHGEELTLAVRSWTNGWDLFGPAEPIVWHRYGRDGRATHWGDDPDWWKLDVHSLTRVRHMLGMEVGANPEALTELHKYGIGSVRSLADYERWSGIHFATRTIEPRALRGEVGF